MEPEKRLYEVQVAGLPLKLRSSHDQETVNELVSLVSQKVEESQSLNPGISFQNALLLASLHIAEDFILLKRSALKEIQNIENQAKDVLSELEDSPLNKLGLEG
ncbi:MAG: cell division protein ZapA [Bdellovibrio sp.]|nr:MAG: cell division protein ZapA [Bdellovibrio sp.]